jgi:hypothetical protein
MAKDDHPIRNKVIAGVITSIIVSGFAFLVYAAPDAFRWMRRALNSIGNYLTSSLSVPNWLLWILIILSAITVIRLIRSLSTRHAETDEPTHRMYTQDSFEGLTWRWSYDVYNRLTKLSAYCPNCDALLVNMREPYRLGGPSSARFYCESCKQERAEIGGGDRNYVDSMIERLIDRKIRNGEWKHVIKRDDLIGENK